MDRWTALTRRVLAVTIPVGIALLALVPLLGAGRAVALPLAIAGALLASFLVERLLVRPRTAGGTPPALPAFLRRGLLGLASAEAASLVIAGFAGS